MVGALPVPPSWSLSPRRLQGGGKGPRASPSSCLLRALFERGWKGGWGTAGDRSDARRQTDAQKRVAVSNLGMRRRGGLETEASTRRKTENARHRAHLQVHARTTMRRTTTVAGSDTPIHAAGGGGGAEELLLLLDRIDVKLEKTNDLVKAEVGAAEARMGTRVDDAVGAAEARMEMKMESLGARMEMKMESLGTKMEAAETQIKGMIVKQDEFTIVFVN
ncbi:hypothetical protein NSK_007841 [Nannochloropsis salina CCMP1776]|uniref:Uncharacterized protein n=1 Tax=Nannochloropsis salina CCMP1776 TaxID=1027361 RepID=A0A4D9CNV2_9STRA|nr:hypothetical protein NSK_007841 [Nannochloropsis salina CCMP1776]|eukprot:TFJ80841.1 hypothetical protein NSK_007841 [Nannochloropsis salina CCMP1776]